MKMYRGLDTQVHHSWPRDWTEVNGQIHASAALTLGQISRWSFYKNLGGSPCRYESCGIEKKTFPLPRIELWPPKPIVSRYTDWATAATSYFCMYLPHSLFVWELRFSRRWSTKLLYSGMWYRAVWSSYFTPKMEVAVTSKRLHPSIKLFPVKPRRT
jgi:hypothetical protein